MSPLKQKRTFFLKWVVPIAIVSLILAWQSRSRASMKPEPHP